MEDEETRGQQGWTRRELFTRLFALRSRGPSSAGEGRGFSGRIALSALTRISDDSMMRIVPVLRRGWTAHVREGGIAYRDDSGQKGTVDLGPEGCAAARLFDGVRKLDQVAAALAADLAIPPDRSVSIVRETFLTLTMPEVYHPLGPVDIPPQEEGQHAK